MLTPLHTEAVTVYLFDTFKDLVDLSNAVSDGILSKYQAIQLRDWLIDHPYNTCADALKEFGYVKPSGIPLAETLASLIDTGNYDIKNPSIVPVLVAAVMKNCKPSPNPKLAELFIKEVLLFN